MENCNSLQEAGLLMAQYLQEWRFRSPYQTENTFSPGTTLAKMLAKEQGNMEWAIEEGINTYKY